MRLHSLLGALDRDPTFQEVISELSAKHERGTQLLSAITPARPFAIAALHGRLQRPILLVVGRPSDARQYANELRAWTPDPDAVLLFPETDALPYDRLPNDADKLSERLIALERLSGLAKQQT